MSDEDAPLEWEGVDVADGSPTSSDDRAVDMDSFDSGEPEMAGRVERRARWLAVAVAVVTVASIGVVIGLRRGGITGAGSDARFDFGDEDLDDDESPDTFEFGGGCDECGDKSWVHYCPECHRVDD